MTAPADSDDVIAAFRLGWALAELRGRYRPTWKPIWGPPGGERADHALPLSDERSLVEQEIELQAAIKGLADQLDVNPELTMAAGNTQTCSARLVQLGGQLQKDPPEAGAWNAFTEAVYEWDARIQDTLVIKASYQLGRGLAETYWCLDPTIDDPRDWRSWEFLLGPRRCLTLGRAMSRLVDYVDPLTVPAVTTSLNAWAAVASDEEQRSDPRSIDALYDQVLLWRDLIRSERRPEDLAASTNPVAWRRIIMPVLEAFWPQLLLGLAGMAVLSFSAAEIAAGGSTKTNTFIAVLSGLGITSTALYARAKGIANSLLDQLKTAFQRDRVGAAATLAPFPKRQLLAIGSGSEKSPAINSASPRLVQSGVASQAPPDRGGDGTSGQ